ncbi:MAG TPA: hypothetical protein VK487_10730 [Candidatus Bathyarchaeia archaeon]|nr:hypothetical protein [Candidatus Bathyarchaeia archaeon]
MQKAEADKHGISPKLFAILYLVVVCRVFVGWWAVVTWWTNLNQPNFAPAKIDKFQVTSVTFFGTAPSYTAINMSIQNTGYALWTITSPAQVNSLTNVVVKSCGNSGNLNCTKAKPSESI